MPKELTPGEVEAESRIAAARESGGTFLTLTGLGLTKLPESVRELGALATLAIAGNRIAELPDWLDRLESLRQLSLTNNELKWVPGVVRRLTWLEDLALDSNPLEGLPEWIAELDRLVRLNVGKTQLGAIPHAIGRLRSLEQLQIDRNELKELPPSIGRLGRLRKLDAFYNAGLQLPDAVGDLVALEALDLDTNHLGHVPEPIRRLRGLKELDLGRNDLTALPPWIGELSSLESLWLNENELRRLPAALKQLPRLSRLFLHGNEALKLPPEILGPSYEETLAPNTPAATPVDVLRYYFRAQRGPTRPLGEAKLILVGEGEVGKTSIVRQLVKCEVARPGEQRTEGIQITTWDLPAGPAEGEAPIKLNVWDFGGQEIYYATHQFFLTQRSLYLLVIAGRAGEDQGRLHDWLRMIRSLGGDAPILVVVNKSEEHRTDLNKSRLKKDYAPNLRGFHNVSCVRGTGIDDLRKAIAREARALDHVNAPVPLAYFDVKAELAAEARTHDYLDYARYDQICRDHGLEEPDERAQLLRQLHELGTVLNYGDPSSPLRLADTNILNPVWVTKGVYGILTDDRLRDRRGVLEPAMLADVLDPARYPPDRHGFLLDMMRKFEMCFDFPDSNGQRVLVPQLLPRDEPDLDWRPDDSLSFEFHYKSLPPGLISRFLVRMQHNLTKKPTYWRSGVVLDVDGNRTLVRADEGTRRVLISAQGPEGGRRRALSVVRDRFREIHATLPKLEVDERVPLPDRPEVTVGYPHLRKLEEKGQLEFIPEGADRAYSVAMLLDGVEDADARRGREEDAMPSKKGPRRSPDPVAPTPPVRHTPWASGSFYLLTFVVVFAAAAVASVYVPWYFVAPILVFGLLATPLIGALGMVNDQQFSQKNFLELVGLSYRQFPLLRPLFGRTGREAAPPRPPAATAAAPGDGP